MHRLWLMFFTVFICTAHLLALDYGLLRPQPQRLLIEPTTSGVSGKDMRQLTFSVTPEGYQDARVFAEQLKRLLDWQPDIVVSRQLEAHGKLILHASVDASVRMPGVLRTNGHSEGYTLHVHENGITLVGDDGDGFYYGLQTILQILLLAAESGDTLPSATITDWPSLSRRAIAIDLSGLSSTSEIDEASFAVLGSLKYNTVFMYLHKAFPGKQYPFKATRPNPLTEAQAAQIKEYCHRHHLRISLAFQFGSHMTWFIGPEPEYEDLYEYDERKPDFKPSFGSSNWCPSNPRLWHLVEDMLQRQLEFFEPEYVLIGHDELDHGSIKTCERCRQSSLGKEDLIARSITTCHEIIGRHSKAESIVWYDQLLSSELRARTRQNVSSLDGPKTLRQLPEQIEIAAWHYAGSNATPAVIDYFSKNGHPVWLASFLGHGLKNNPQHAALHKAQGVILTLWYTVSNWMTPSGISRVAMDSVVTNSNWNWNVAAASNPASLGDTVHTFGLLYKGAKIANRSSTFVPLDLSSVPNATVIQDNGKYRELQTLFDAVGSRMVISPTSKIPFRIQEQKVLLAGASHDKDTLPRLVRIPVDKEVRSLHFLHACNRPKTVPGLSWLNMTPKIGEYRLIPSNPENRVITIPLRYRLEITDWINQYSAWLSPTVERGAYAPGVTYQLTAMSWNAPDNQAIGIKEIYVSTEMYNDMNPMVFGITAEEDTGGAPKSEYSTILWQDDFSYASDDQLRQTWNLSGAPQLETGKTPFPGKAMTILLPTSSKRVDVGWNKSVCDFSNATAISFDVLLDFEETGTLIPYIYLGNSQKGYYYMHGMGLSQTSKVWQKVLLPLDGFTSTQTVPAGYGMNSITQLKFSFFYDAKTAGKVRIANVKIGTYEGADILVPTR